MKPAGLVTLSLLVLVACDQENKKAELVHKTASADTAPLLASAMPAMASAVSVSPTGEGSPPATKPPKDCGTGPAITIDDPELEAAIRLKAKKPKDKNPAPLTEKDLASVASLNVTAKSSLDELDGCVFPKLVGLKFLYLPKGSYRDLGPIQNLTRLETLRASISEVEDLKPLEKLTNLDQLDLGRTHVRDLSVLAKLVNLTELSLDDTQVSDLTPLASCTKLEVLSIKNTLVKDVRPLKNMKKLRVLNVKGTALENLNVLEPLRARGMKLQTN